jgi:hypothetical protein
MENLMLCAAGKFVPDNSKTVNIPFVNVEFPSAPELGEMNVKGLGLKL